MGDGEEDGGDFGPRSIRHGPISSVALHDLRRSWASHLLAAGTPMDTVRRLGGWASNATLERFYLAPTERAVQLAIDASGSIL